MTAAYLLAIATFLAVVFYGAKVLERMPKNVNAPDKYDFRSVDAYISISIDSVTEQDFQIQYVSGWTVGRNFYIGGKPRYGDDWPEKLKKKEGRIAAEVHAISEWYETARIGWVNVSADGSFGLHLWLPPQLAVQVLDELRRDPKQVASFGITLEATDKGDRYAIYSFSLSEAYD